MKTAFVKRGVFGCCNHGLYYQRCSLSFNNMYQ